MNKGRKISGGKYHANRKKKFYERQNQEKLVSLKETKRKTLRVKGGNTKTILLNADEVNLKTKEGIKRVKIKNVVETPSNVFLARQNRLVKSAIIETEFGKAKITNRPSQEGCINAVLIKEEFQ